jgi:hypothetical protein
MSTMRQLLRYVGLYEDHDEILKSGPSALSGPDDPKTDFRVGQNMMSQLDPSPSDEARKRRIFKQQYPPSLTVRAASVGIFPPQENEDLEEGDDDDEDDHSVVDSSPELHLEENATWLRSSDTLSVCSCGKEWFWASHFIVSPLSARELKS